MVTAELAVSMPVLVLLLFVGLAAIGVAQARVRACDAAREAARAVVRGDSGRAGAQAAAAAGRPVEIGMALRDPEHVQVTVRFRYRPLGWLPGVVVAETVVAQREPSGASAGAVGGSDG